MNTPELDKMIAVKSESQAIGGFLDWLQNEKNRSICEMDPEQGEYYPVYKSIEAMLAEYFEIDLNKIEHERTAILEEHRKLNA